MEDKASEALWKPQKKISLKTKKYTQNSLLNW